MEIRKSKARFLSIFFIVALGVAFFSGIQAASPDMRFTGDVYYDEQQLMDLKLIGTLGLTEEDVTALSDLSGVEYAEGGFFEDVLCGDGENQKVIHIESYSSSFNLPVVMEGRVPSASGECFVDDNFASGNHLSLGQVLTVKEEGENGRLNRMDYTIVGIGQSPLYISFNRGNTTLGSGEINGFILISPEDFDQEVYTQIYLRAHGADQLISYTDAYNDLVDRTRGQVEGIENERCQYRYDSIMSDAMAELADGEAEYEDGKKEAHQELSDALEELRDGKRQYEAGRARYLLGQKAFEDGKKQLEDGKTELEDARTRLNDGKTQLANGKAELASAYATLLDNQATVDAGWAELNAGKAQLEDARSQITNGRAELEAGKVELAANEEMLWSSRAQIIDGQAQIAAGENQIASGKQQIEYFQYLVTIEKQALEYAKDNELIDEAFYEYSLGQIALQDQELANQYDNILVQEQELIAKKQELADGLIQVDAGLAEIEVQKGVIAEKELELEAAEAEFAQKEAEALPEIEANEQKLTDAQAQLDAGWAEYYGGLARIQSSEATIAEGEQQLLDGEKTITENEQLLADSEIELADAGTELADALQKLNDGRVEYSEGKAEAIEKLSDAEEELADARQKIADIAHPEWLLSTRSDLPEYNDYGDNADRIRNLGRVFPVIFFLVAALISLTTMARMVEDQRTQIGTLKALGYGKRSIMGKFTGYALLATVGGSIFGVLIGEKIIPWVIITAYGIMYHNSPSTLPVNYEWKFALIASGAAVFCTVGATLFSCMREVAETPASLMRPPAPKKGKRILLERIPFIWKHLNFTWKSSMRNLFRYKKRLFMTIFGIAGSMGLMLIGFGIHDSIMDVALKQYSDIQHYDGTIIHDEDASQEEVEEFKEFLRHNDRIQQYTGIEMTKMTVTNGHSNLSAYIYVPEDLDNFSRDVTLKNRVTGERYELTDAGAVICEKTSTLLGVGVGDELTIQRDHRNYKVLVAVVTENYMAHYVYLTEKVYQDTFGEVPEFVDTVFTVKDEYHDQMEDVGREILSNKAALSISYTASLAGTIYRMLTTLSLVVVVLIVSAGLLAFVVLYNLNNINITERQRELATLKVLGFFDREVSSYVFRENILLTIVGIIAGAFFGIALHRYTITTVEVDAVMFGREIKPLSFVYCGTLTAAFSLIVNLFMHQKLKKINMVESLKSVE